MGVVSRYAEPRDAAELGRLIEVFLTAEFGWGAGGGSGERGADLDYELERETVGVLVAPDDQLIAIKDMLRGGGHFELLDDDERAIIEAHRANRRVEPPDSDRLRPSLN